MFLRKLLGDKDEKKLKNDLKTPMPAGMQTMGASLQRRFAKGVQYNMKLVIKGDRNVGKTALFHRLQGEKFKEEYIPTDEIQVTSIQWNYKATDDIVKVEVWDVVDKGKKKKKIDGLKLDTASDGEDDPPDRMYEDPCLDAEFLDVYKGTHGVIMVMDITKQWTFDYIQREMPKIPSNLPVLVLANHRDMGHHRTVTEDQVRTFLEEVDRPPGAGQIRYAESSMRNAFGLKYIHKFFNLPFLQLQRETLLKQLETNSREIQSTMAELDIHEESEEQNYELFLDAITNKRREQQDKLSLKAVKDAKKTQDLEKVAAELKAQQEALRNGTTPEPTSMSVAQTGTGEIKHAPPAKPFPGLQMSASKSTPSLSQAAQDPLPTAASTPAPISDTPPPQDEKQGGFMSRLFGGKGKDKTSKAEPVIPTGIPNSKSMPVMNSLEDFVLDEGIDASFLDDTKDVKYDKPAATNDLSDSDDEGGNPLVTGFQEDLESDDEVTPSVPSSGQVLAKDLELTSDEEDVTPSSVPVIKQDIDIDSDSDTNNHFTPSSAKRSRPKPKDIVNHSRTLSNASSSSSSATNPISGHGRKPVNDTNQSLDKSNSNCTSGAMDGLDFSQSSMLTHGGDVGGAGDQEEEEEEEEEEDANVNGVVVLQDEDIESEEETTSSSKPTTDSGLATDTTQENDSSQTSETKTLGLEFEDLSVLEKGFSFNTGLPRVESHSSDLAQTSSRADSADEQDSGSASRKKKKHRSKDKEREGEKIHKKKHKKHKEKDREDTDDSKEKKKKKKKKPKEIEENNKDDDLEAFLGDDTPGGGAYEAL